MFRPFVFPLFLKVPFAMKKGAGDAVRFFNP